MTNEELIALIKKNPVSVGCGFLSLLLAGALYFRSEEIPAAEDELTQKTALAERYALNLKNAVQLKEQFDAIAAANKIIDGRIIRISQLGNNTQFFYKLQSDTGVKLVDFRQNTTAATPPKGPKTTFVPVAFVVSVQGTLPQILDFLRQLESGPHYSRILAATCAGNPISRSGLLTLSLSLELLGLP
jgi:hypothetical protein